MPTLKHLYCSLDIETSGFDPLTNEILEVGFVFFELTENGLSITREWSQVFKATKPVPPGILGLTGITQKELEEAPSFSEHRDFLQKQLGQAIIVGHNISFDLKFLEAFGLKFSGQTIDTLDLVQFILPTHHSYNLENLMHTFGIKHQNAHRALEDSKATLKVLEKLLKIYAGFSNELKNHIANLIKPFALPWEELIKLDWPAKNFVQKTALPAVTPAKPTKAEVNLNFAKNSIYNFPLGEDYLAELALILQKSKPDSLLVVPKVQQVMDFWRQGLAEPVFSPQILFDKKKFVKFLRKEDLTLDETKFLLKILVWQYTNWQRDTILDLNLSFFGGQFREQITGGKIKGASSAKVLSCDMATFLLLAESKFYKSRRVILAGANEFENAVSSNIGSRVSWGYFNYLLKSVYNPEIQSGNLKLKDKVRQALTATDLFFGLAGALLQTDPPGFVNFKISDEVEYSPKYQKIKKAAENFIGKLTEINKQIKSPEITNNLRGLKDFFSEEPNRVKWIELSESRCTFHNSPLEIASLAKQRLRGFKGVVFIDALGVKKLWQYYIRRLGLDDFEYQEVLPRLQNNLHSGQSDLFSGRDKQRQINFYERAGLFNSAEIAGLLLKGPLPAAVLFGSSLQVRQFYEQYYRQLKTEASVLAQTSSGGSNKLFRNFGINPKTILLATDKFVLKQLNSISANELVSHLPVKTLILCHLPFEQFTHPYQQALAGQFENPFLDFSLPKAVYNFHGIVKFFYSPVLENIFVFDPKLGKDYWAVFKDYLMKWPGIRF